MKTKKLIWGLTLIIFALGVVLSLGFLNANKIQAEATGGDVVSVAESGEKTSNWLLLDKNGNGDDFEATQAEVEAGVTAGYGKFELNKQNVGLSARANAGFKLVGWVLSYSTSANGEDADISSDETAETSVFLYNVENLSQTTYTIESERVDETPVVLTMDYIDENLDGYYDKGELTISNIFSDMTINAVFDYIYYNVEITDIFNFINTSALNSFAKEETVVYYASSEQQGNTYTYNEAYYKVEDKTYYFGTLYETNGVVYTKRMLNGTEQKIDVSRGAYRLGETVNVSLNLDVRNYYEEDGVNIDVLNVLLVENGVTNLLQDDESLDCFAKIYKEENNFDPAKVGRTTKIDAQVKIAQTNNQTETLSIEYNKLYLATINVKVDGEAEGNDYIRNSVNEILNSLTISYFFCKVSNNAYYVKTAVENENGQTFELYCNPYIYGESLNYLYYIFEDMSIEGNVNNPQISNNLLRYSNIVDNFAINLEYSSARYRIDFEPYIKLDDANLIKITDTNFKVDEPITNLLRGSSVVCGEESTAQNVGYKFYGYSLTDDMFESNTSLTVEIDTLMPENITVLAIYEYANYNLSFANYDSIKLTNNATDYYAIKNLSIVLNDFELANLTSEQLRAASLVDNLKTFKLTDFDLPTLKIGDQLIFRVELNDGFKNLNFYILNFEKTKILEKDNVLEYSLPIDSQILSQIFASDNLYSDQTINLQVEESFAEYNFSYYIDVVNYSSLNKDIVMAEISATTANDQAKMSYEYFNEQDAASQPVTRINVSNLKLYDEVVVKAKTRTFVVGERNYKFNFVRFTADNKTSLNSNQLEDETYSYNLKVTRDGIEIKVVYVAQTSVITIVTNESNAFETDHFSDYVFLKQTSEVQLDENNQGALDVGELNVQFRNANDPFGFGFVLRNYRLVNQNNGDQIVDASNLESPFYATFNIEGEQSYILEINFDVIKFNVVISQYGKAFLDGNTTKPFNGDILEFKDDNCLTFNNSYLLSFDLPEGAYTKMVSFKNGEELIEMPELAQFGLGGVKYSYNFSISDVKNYFLTYGTLTEDKNIYTVNMQFEYDLLTFDLNVEYRFLVSKGNKDNEIQFPNLCINYSLDGEDYQLELTGAKVLTFENVPYGVSPTISLLSALPVGYISTYNWGYSVTKSAYTMGRHNGFSSINLKKISSNENLIYSVEYQAFSVKIIIDGDVNSGNPEISKNSVELFDSLQITTNANKSLGYKFKQIYYFSNYTLGAEGWSENRYKVYTFNGSNFVLNDNLNYFPTQNYYIKKEYSENPIFLDREVNFNNYAIVNNSIYFYLVYDYIDISIVNLSEDFVNEGYTTNLKDLDILPQDYAEYFVYKLVNGDWQLLADGEYVSVLDSVRILINIKRHTIQNITQTDEQEIDLDRGLKLLSISYGMQFGKNFELDGNVYDYIVQFNVKEVISNVDDEDNLTIAYAYVIDNKTMELTTNINDESFYQNFLMSFEGYGKFGGRGAGGSEGQKTLTATMQFLATAQFSHEFKMYGEYFKISKIDFMFDGKLIEQKDYAYYGIELVEDRNYFYIRFLDNLKIVLKVEPILYFYNHSNYENKAPELVVADENGNYNLSLEFLCNVDGSGKAQTLTIGDSESFNIVTSPLIQQSMKVQYCNSLGQLCQPTDVGTYSVEISFDSNGAFSWLGEIQNLSYNVYLNITQLRITASLSYRNSDNFSMEYNGNAKLDFNFISQYLFFKDVYTGNYLNISYLNSNFQFETNPNCYITIYNDEFDAQIVNAACGSGLNISIINFKLLQDSFSNNFILVLPQGIFAESINDLPNLEEQDLLVLEQKFEITQKILTISGIYVYDKVYDGTNKVDYDFVNCKFVKDTILEDRGLVGIDFENLKLEFEDRLGKVGTNKLIKVNTDNVLIDRDPTSPRAKNYKLVVEDFYKTIYPYSTEEVYVAGIGNISVVNKRGLIDENDEQKSYRQYVNLIKIGAKLDVEVFYKNGNEYRDIYTRISDYLSNTVAFAVGYKLSFVTDGFREDINKNLFLNLPKVRRLSQALWIDETAAGKLEYLVADNLMLDLQLAPSNVKCVVILQAKQFFTWWQITLIVLLILLIIILIILIYIHERRKKKKKDILNEKI